MYYHIGSQIGRVPTQVQPRIPCNEGGGGAGPNPNEDVTWPGTFIGTLLKGQLLDTICLSWPQ
jgi:hypothetical protein